MIDATKYVLDHDVERILLGTYKQDRTAQELIKAYGIPVAVCYRKIKELKKAKLLSVSGKVFDRRNKKVELYRANLEDAYIYHNNGQTKIRFKVILQISEDFRLRYESYRASSERTGVPQMSDYPYR